MRKLMAAVAAVFLLATFAQTAIADIDDDDQEVNNGTVSSDGRHVDLTVEFECDEGERYKMQLTVTQDDTGAWAQKHTSGECTGDEEVAVSAPARGKVGFDTSNDTEACAAIRTRAQHEGVTDAEQFCEDDINLDEAEDDDDDDDEDDEDDD